MHVLLQQTIWNRIPTGIKFSGMVNKLSSAITDYITYNLII